MNLREAVRFASRLLSTASEFDSATGGVNPSTQTYATIKVLRAAGVEAVDDAQQAEFLHD
jgi:proteasome beta subunit